MRARIVWKTADGLVVPVTAVLRINGQFFAFVAEPTAGGKLIAKQRAIKVGPIAGDNYPVLDGIKPGERVVVSGAQKLADGAPISGRRRGQPRQPQSLAQALDPVFVDTFIRRPILASVCSLVIILAGAIAIPTLPIAQFPELAPPQVQVTAFYNGANAETVETAVTTPIEQAINGVEGMQYMTSTSGNDGTCGDHRHLRHHAQPRHRRRRRAEPHLAGRRAAAERGEAGRHLGDEGRRTTSCSPPAALRRARRVRPAVHQQLRRPLRQRRDQARARRRRRRRLRRSAATRCGCGSIPTSWPAATSPPTRSCRRCASRTCRWRPGRSARAPARPGQTYQISVRAAGRLTEPAEFDNIILKRSADGALVRVKDVGRTELGAESYTHGVALQRPRRRRLRRAAAADRQRAAGLSRRQRRDRAAVEALSAGPEDRDRLRHDDASCPSRFARW